MQWAGKRIFTGFCQGFIFLCHNHESLTQTMNKKSPWFLLCLSFLNHLASGRPSSFDSNTLLNGCPVMGASILLLFASFYLVLSLSHRFYICIYFLLLWTERRNQSCIPPPTTKLCCYNRVICFPSVIESSILSEPTNKHRFRREKRRKKKAISAIFEFLV